MLAVKSDLDGTGLLHRLYDLQKALQEVINRPEPHHHEAVGHALRAVYEAIDHSEADGFGPSWTGLLAASGFGGVLGSALRANIEAAYRQNNITPSIAKEEIQQHINDLERLSSVAERATGALGELGKGSEDLVAEECEVGFTIPRGAVEGRLDKFIEELREFDGIFRILSEVATEEPGSYELRSLGSSDYAVFLKADAVVAALVASSMERIIVVYQQLLEIRRLRNELSDQDVPSEVFDRLDTYANSKMAKAIEDIAINLVLEYYPSEDGKRARQLVVELGAVLSMLANRIDRGYRVEVRTPLQPVSGAEGQAASDLTLPPHFVVIRRAARALAFVRPDGEAILELSESTKSRKAPPKQKPVTKQVAPKKAPRREGAGTKHSTAKKTAAKKRPAAKKKAVARKSPAKKTTAPNAEAPPAAPTEEPKEAPANPSAPKKKSRKKKRGARAKSG